MNTAILTSARKLPSADWIAIGIGMVGIVLGRIYGPLASLLALAVFGPPLLREIGWLKDGDEYTQQIVHRAGFHTMLVMAVLIFADRYFIPWGWAADPNPVGPPYWGFRAAFMCKMLVTIFLMSYLIQYWGAPLGVSRILIGFAVLTLIEIGIGFKLYSAQGAAFIIAPLVILVAIIVLAWLARKWPRSVGVLLLALMILSIYQHVDSMRSVLAAQGKMSWFMLEAMLQTALPLGIAGISLSLWHQD